MNIEILHPFVFLVLLALPVVWWQARRSLSDFGGAQLALMAALRTLIVVLLALALADVRLVRESPRAAVVLAVDTSRSVGGETLKRADALMQELAARANVPLRAVNFESEPRPAPVLAIDSAGGTTRSSTSDGAAGTDIASALRFARAMLPEGYVGRVVIVTDGRETQGDMLAEAAALRARGIDLVVLVPPESNEPEVLVAGLDAPVNPTPGATADLVAHVLSTRRTSARMEVFVDGFRIGEPRTVTLAPGETLVPAPVRLAKGGAHEYTVLVASDNDAFAGNNRASQVVVLPPELKVLVIEQREDDAKFLARVLRAAGIETDVRTPAGFPTDMVDLDRYACVVLSDVPASDVTPSQMKMVKSYVEDLGGGLVMVGGEDSFGLGGWFGTPVEEVLPVRLDVEKKKEQPTLAMEILLDKSGSMQGQKVELAKDASIAALELLGPEDFVGVITFDAEAHEVVRLQRASSRALISSTISTISAGGGTNIFPALELASRELNGVQTRIKHVIVLSDGQTQDADFAGLVARMVRDRITVSTVAVGREADVQRLQTIARWGRGRFYFTNDALSIPQIFARETATASRSAVVEEPFQPRVVRDAEVIRGIDFKSCPYLLGYCATSPKPSSEVILASERSEPLLARWRYGLGKTAAFTSDAKNRWSAEWIGWAGFPKLWAQIVRDTMRPRPHLNCDARLTFEGDAGVVRVDATDASGRLRNNMQVAASVLGPEGSSQKVTLLQQAPGQYVGRFVSQAPGTYVVSARLLRPGGAGETGDVVVTGRIRGAPAEFVALGPDREALSRLAAAAGGRLVEADEWAKDSATISAAAAKLAAPGGRTVGVRQPVWPVLLWSALAAFFVDLLLRRLDLRNLRPPSILDFRFWILDYGSKGRNFSPRGSVIQNPKSKIQNHLLVILAMAAFCGALAAAERTVSPERFDAEASLLGAKRADTLERLVRVLLVEGKAADARALLEADVKRIAGSTREGSLAVADAKLLYLAGIVEESAGDAPRRDELFALVRKLCARDKSVHYQLADEFEGLHRGDIVEFEYRRVLELPPAVELREGKPAEAVFPGTPCDRAAVEALGRIAFNHRRWATAAECYGTLARMLKGSAELQARTGRLDEVQYLELVARGRRELEAGSVAAAADFAERAWKVSPRKGDACVLGERAAEALKDAKLAGVWRARSDVAVAALREGIAAEPRSAENYNSLGWLLAGLGRDLDEGVRAVERALELRPDEEALFDTLAELQFAKGDAPAAAKTMRRVIDACPFANDYYRAQLERFEAGPKKPAGGGP